jgi:hypothetical protein
MFLVWLSGHGSALVVVTLRKRRFGWVSGKFQGVGRNKRNMIDASFEFVNVEFVIGCERRVGEGGVSETFGGVSETFGGVSETFGGVSEQFGRVG